MPGRRSRHGVPVFLKLNRQGGGYGSSRIDGRRTLEKGLINAGLRNLYIGGARLMSDSASRDKRRLIKG